MHVSLYARLALAMILVAIYAGETRADAQRPVALVDWSSSQSIERLARSSHRIDFFPLSNHYVSQDNKIFCGPVSSAIVLNALRLGKRDGLPQDEQSIAPGERSWLPDGFDPFYEKYTPQNVFNDRTKSKVEVLGKPIHIDGELTADFGLQLRQLAQVLTAHGLDVKVRVVDDSADAETIRHEIVANLATAEDYVLVNYARKSLGQDGGGHISPLGAYDETTNSFLIMDVNPNRAPWVWVSSGDLIEAMRTFDTVENRGYVLVSEASPGH